MAELCDRAREATRADEITEAVSSALAALCGLGGDLGGRVLTAEESGEPVAPAVAERHATARRLHDQARTSMTMVKVRRVAEEGLELLAEPGSTPAVQPDREEQAPRDTGTTRAGRRRRWLGVPRWLWPAVALDAVASVPVFVVSEPPAPVSAQARNAVDGLRTPSVYEEPGGPGVIDVPRRAS